jgi:ATP-dependent RNA helicase SUPV3L1/SUV3
LARLADRKLLLAAAERHLPALLAARAAKLAGEIGAGNAALALDGPRIAWDGEVVAGLAAGRSLLAPRIELDLALTTLPVATRQQLQAALETWLETAMAPLAPLKALEAATREAGAGPELRALLIRLSEAGGMMERAGSGLERLGEEQRARLRKLGVRIGALDLFVPTMLKSMALSAWRTLLAARGQALPAPVPNMPPVAGLPGRAAPPPGYRALGKQALRLDIAEKLLRAAHEARVAAKGRSFVIDPALAISTGLATPAYAHLLRLGGFQAQMPRALPAGAFGPPVPARWHWRPPRREVESARSVAPDAENAFAILAELVR